MLKNKDFLNLSRKWLAKSVHYKYNYNFTWLGRPIIKYPDDIVVMQELIWKIKTRSHNRNRYRTRGSIIFTASMLKMMNVKRFKVIGIDIDIRKHNLQEIKKSIVYKHLDLIEGSSIDIKTKKIVEKKLKSLSQKK